MRLRPSGAKKAPAAQPFGPRKVAKRSPPPAPPPPLLPCWRDGGRRAVTAGLLLGGSGCGQAAMGRGRR
eukprot:10223955-Alexandrium_andersonii.AAC.1